MKRFQKTSLHYSSFMLFAYFLLKLYHYFFIFCAILVFILSASNVFVKFSLAQFITLIPSLFVTVVPVMLTFAIPIASCLAVYTVVHSCFISEEFTFLQMSTKGKRMLFLAVLTFSSSLLCFYIPLLFQWAPSTYLAGKKLLLQTAKQNIGSLQEGRLHTTIPQMAIFFKKKHTESTHTSFNHLFCSFDEKNQAAYLFSAKKGIINQQILQLEEGTAYHHYKEQHYCISFNYAHMNLETLIGFQSSKLQITEVQSKYLTWHTLISEQNNYKVLLEKHKRIIQALWQWLFPLLMLQYAILFHFFINMSMIGGIALSCILFFAMYATLILGQLHYSHYCINLIIFYGILIFILLSSYFLYKKNTL